MRQWRPHGDCPPTGATPWLGSEWGQQAETPFRDATGCIGDVDVNGGPALGWLRLGIHQWPTTEHNQRCPEFSEFIGDRLNCSMSKVTFTHTDSDPHTHTHTHDQGRTPTQERPMQTDSAISVCEASENIGTCSLSAIPSATPDQCDEKALLRFWRRPAAVSKGMGAQNPTGGEIRVQASSKTGAAVVGSGEPRVPGAGPKMAAIFRHTILDQRGEGAQYVWLAAVCNSAAACLELKHWNTE